RKRARLRAEVPFYAQYLEGEHMRLYPDLYGRRFAWMLADLLTAVWIYLCVQAGLWVNNLVLQLDALAQGVINAGKTFDSWILSFEQGIPNGVPYLSDFLHRTAEALKTHSGDSLISAGRAIYTRPYSRLLAYSRNPAEDWYLRRFEPLARAELERHGLTVERYFGARPALKA